MHCSARWKRPIAPTSATMGVPHGRACHSRSWINCSSEGAEGAVKNPVLVLTGPTGTGKTDWAARLAGTHPIEIVSVDSALVYRGLDIGTAKPSRELRASVPHHLIDVCEPTESYSAGRFVSDAMALIAAIHGRGRLPVLVGGTMLYFRALWRGM